MSGCGTHADWVLVEPEHDLEEWSHRQNWIAVALGSDTAVCDPQRLTRLPGAFNRKEKYGGNPPKALLLKCEKQRFSWFELRPKHCGEPQVAEPPAPAPKRERPGGELLPGDDFMRRAEWSEVLPPGWVQTSRVNSSGYCSYSNGANRSKRKTATVSVGSDSQSPAIYVWDTDEKLLPPHQWHTMFFAYATSHHGGDMKAATRQLAAEGYGKQAEPFAGWSDQPGIEPVPAAGELIVSTRPPEALVVGAANVNHPHTLNDIGMGRRIVAVANGTLRYVSDRGVWFQYNGKFWEADSKALGPAKVAKTAGERLWREMAELGPEVPKAVYGFAKGANSRRSIDAGVALARSEPGVEAKSSQFDTNPFLLNCKNGVLNMRTLKLAPHEAGQLLTKIANVEFDPQASCPKWREFIKTVTCGDDELARFLQRSFGLALSADQSEQALWVHHGEGGNGKGTFLTVVSEMMGDYSGSAAIESFVHQRNEADRTRAVVGLIGKRLAFAQETDEACKLSEQAVKALTGSDPITFRRLYEEETETFPTWHIHLAVNERPQIRGTDHGIWRRVKLVPWNHQFDKAEERKRSVVIDEFMAEAPGILNWLLAGFTDWMANGLQEPAAVLAATEDYREESDVLGDWVADDCETGPRLMTPAVDLFTAYREWCKRCGLRPFTRTRFGTEMTKRGFLAERPKEGGYRDKTIRLGIAPRQTSWNRNSDWGID